MGRVFSRGRVHELSRARLFLRLGVVLAATTVALAQPGPVLFLVDSEFDGLRSTIHAVDPATGAMVLRADLGTFFTPVFGLAAGSGSLLYLAGTDTGPTDACGGGVACLLVRVVLDPISSTPSEVGVVGPVFDGGGIVTGITGLTFDRDGRLYAISQDTESLYTIDPATAAAIRIGTVNLDLHGGDITFDGDGRLWAWTNIGAGSGLYEIDPVTALASAFDVHPDLSFAGMAALGHANLLYGASTGDDRLYEIDSTIGLTGVRVRLTFNGVPFDHARGDLDSPFCSEDAACDDSQTCTSDTCSPGGCLHVTIPGCCVTDQDCVDSDRCTLESCVENRCESSPVNTDDDGDRVADCQDRCLGTPGGQPVDENGCSVLQLCPCEGSGSSGSGRREFLRCVTAAARALVPVGKGAGSRRGKIIHEAVLGSCGRAGGRR